MVEVKFNNEAKEEILKGVNILGDAVKVTLGASGRNVVIDQGYGVPHVTKDGVTVARSIELDDPIQNMGAQMVKEASIKTNDEAGDATTTSTVIAQSLVNLGMKELKVGANSIAVKRGMEKACRDISNELDKLSTPIDKNDFKKIEQIASISANNDTEVGKIVVGAIKTVSTDGLITVEQSSGMNSYIDVVDGMELNRGFLSPHFVTDESRMECVLENPFVLVTDFGITNTQTILNYLDYTVQNNRSLLIISPNVDGEALNTLVLNKVRGSLKVCAIKAPEYGAKQNDVLGDIAVLVGAKFISKSLGGELTISNPDEINSVLGGAKKIVISRNKTLIVSGEGDAQAVMDRSENLKAQASLCTNEYDKEQVLMRSAKLSGGVAVLHVGSATEVEGKEKKDRVDDALSATRSAVAEGIIAGGGVGFIKALNSLNKPSLPVDEQSGYDIVLKSIIEPFNNILENGGYDAKNIIKDINAQHTEGNINIGFNVKDGVMCDMVANGIIDPTKALKTALKYAVSVASTILTVECTISNIKKQQ